MSKKDLQINWVETTIGDIATIVTGSTPTPKEETYYGGDIPFVTPGDLEHSQPIQQTARMVTRLGAEQGRLLPAGAVLVSCIGKLGKVGVLGREGITNQQINAIVPSDVVLPAFIAHWARTIQRWLEANASATTVAIINKGRFSKAPFGLPPISEQRRIVAKIESLQTHSHRARESLKVIAPLLEKFRESVLAAAFRGDLTAGWRAKNLDVEPASELLEHIRKERRRRWEKTELAKMRAKGKEPKNDKWKTKYKEPAPADSRDLLELPETWCWVSLETISYIQGGITLGQKRKDGNDYMSVPYLRVANVQRGFLVLDEVKYVDVTKEKARRA